MVTTPLFKGMETLKITEMGLNMSTNIFAYHSATCTVVYSTLDAP